MFDSVGSRGCLSSGVGSSDAYLVVFGCFSGSVSSFCNIWSRGWVVLDNLVSVCMVVFSQEDVWVFW